MPDLPTVPLRSASDLLSGLDSLLRELEDWLSACMPHHLRQDWQGIHDEGTFLTAWAGYYAYTGDTRVPELALDLFHKWKRWEETNFTFGYHPRQEVHHGTEHFLIFLDWLQRIAAEDSGIGHALEAGVSHVGNWSCGPDWYDWEERRYVSYSLGSEETGCDGFNFVDHVRLLHMALSGYRVSESDRYLELGRNYGREWARAIRDLPEVPLYLEGAEDGELRFRELLRTMLQAAPQEITQFARFENHFASGTPKLLRELQAATGEELFGQAALRLAQGARQDLESSIANPAGHFLSLLLEDGVRSAELAVDESCFADWETGFPDGVRLAMDVDRPPAVRDSLGYRKDMPTHFVVEAGRARPICRPAPGNLMLAWTVTGREEFALDACGLALAQLQLARNAYGDGRHHGCTAQSVAAAVRGHGRCWGIGGVAAVLAHPGCTRRFADAGRSDGRFPGLVTN